MAEETAPKRGSMQHGVSEKGAEERALKFEDFTVIAHESSRIIRVIHKEDGWKIIDKIVMRSEGHVSRAVIGLSPEEQERLLEALK